MNLSKNQLQFLKGEAHNLKPVVLLGANGLTEGVLAEVELALEHHELIKVKVPTDDREMKVQIFDAIIRETGAIKINKIGHVLTLYKANPERKKPIQLPRG